MRKIVQLILKNLARATLHRYKPTVIGITGNVGKTSAKEAVYAILASRFTVRKSEKSYNNEFGVPLTILGITTSGMNPFSWLVNILRACARIIYTRYPEILVLEMGVDKPKDMEYLLEIVTPDIALFTSMGDIPTHVENFVSREALIREKLKLASAVSVKGYVTYNADISWWLPITEKAKAHKITYGFSADADVKLYTPEMRFAEKDTLKIPLGITCKVEYKGSVVPFRLDGALSYDGAYLAGAAVAVGSILGMNLVEIASAFARYEHPKGRLKLLEGIKGSMILDDTYNAGPSSLRSALDTLAVLPAKRKIAVLGDMLELGDFTESAHREMGRKASEVCAVVYTVGAKTKFACDELIAKGFQEHKNLFSYDTSEQAAQALYPAIQEGDMILVKGSQGMRMEKVVKEILAHPERASAQLVRQEKKWLRV